MTIKIKMMLDVEHSTDAFTREIHRPGYRPQTKRSLSFGFKDTDYERQAEKERNDRRRLEGKKR